MNHLLLNVLIIWACIFLYQMLWLERMNRDSKRDKIVFTVIIAVGIAACMSFPICYFPEYPFDLRGVLLMIGSLYGGLNAGVVLALFTITVRMVQGMGGLWTMILVVLLACVLISLFIRYYSRLKMSGRLIAGAALAGGSGVLTIAMVSALRQNDAYLWSYPLFGHVIMFGLLHAGSAYISIYFIEKMKENAQMRAEIRQREKMDMLGELAASVAHEIRNPMTVVRGFMQLMNGHSFALKRFNEYAPMIIEELDRAESILSDYLSFAKPQETAWERIDLSGQLSHAVHTVTPYAHMNQVEIQTYWQTSLSIIYDRKKFGQLIVNLLKNGIEAMPDGGMLDVELYREEGHAVIRILDKGIGMTEEELGRLGSLFYSTKTKGTGIGIMICYKIIEAAGGTIRFDSKKLEGTTVTIRLPLATELSREELQ
ncbi:ATP-binding protein [Paenibacillus doosanensis]|uniref:histidine kinase n=1 Tax=Paenibacillus konkukensis TaxID=2020716 RepID=A0ABY4RN80_9BACL|nr:MULTISPECIES: ATP-binding protein [Paenibacillus]MCS7461778.1 ATP-binding protein [Paenibacillus doosanensis]UQZ83618.1 Sporulation kinase E [Paenibacillus konkukensis]